MDGLRIETDTSEERIAIAAARSNENIEWGMVVKLPFEYKYIAPFGNNDRAPGAFLLLKNISGPTKAL